jgi:hypothetical protein
LIVAETHQNEIKDEFEVEKKKKKSDNLKSLVEKGL